MKNMILYGAFDRYNYGDNLMPIVFHRFLTNYYPEILAKYRIEYAGLFHSDLSKFECKRTNAINNFFDSVGDECIIIVVGGETLGSRGTTLYSHYVHNLGLHKLIKRLHSTGPRISGAIGGYLCRTGFEFPFTPPPEVFHKDAKVCYNSVGGKLPCDGWQRSILLDRLKDACYVSLRDKRSVADMSEIGHTIQVAPDPVSAISDLFDEQYILKRVSARVRDLNKIDYCVFQAAPNKCEATASQIAEILAQASHAAKTPFVLLPIGYAGGHDDRKLLYEVAKSSAFHVLDDLNIWEILWVIKNSKGYFGTSLHGAITAMMYAKPHFGIGRQPKLAAYLDEWSVKPFTDLRSVQEIPRLVEMLDEDFSVSLSKVARKTRDGALRNMHDLLIAAQVFD